MAGQASEDWFSRPSGPDEKARVIKEELIAMVLWGDRNSARSRQRALGPSELGIECDRRLAYRLAGFEPINTSNDPWPAIVGTSVHAWLEREVNRYQESVADLTYRTELTVDVDPMVRGHTDALRVKDGTVIDYKTTGADGMRKVKKGEIRPGYITQIMLYGFGLRKAGYTINDVALVFIPRSGWISDLQIWRAAYDEAEAKRALARMYRIADRALELEVDQPDRSRRLDLIEATPGDSCALCPFYNRAKHFDDVADSTGCPGR